MRTALQKSLAGFLVACFVTGSVADEEFSLVINPFTGDASLRNDTSATLDIDSYYVTSTSVPLLAPATWSSFEDGARSGWRESFSETGNRLGELNLLASQSIGPNESLSIGKPYTPFVPSVFGEEEPGFGTIDLSYTLANESVARRGDVEFSVRNTLVFVVDPTTGSATLENQSNFPVMLDSYLLKSSQGVLSAANWSPLSGSTDGWRSSSGANSRLAEGNLLGATLLAPNDSLALGTPVDPSLLNDEEDLVLEFTTTDFEAVIKGGVLFGVSGPTLTGDCNADGVVSFADADCTADTDLDAFLAGLSPASLRGDADGDGTVGFPDFLTLSGSFGQPGQYTEGDFDKDGSVGFPDFLTLSSNFGQNGAAAAVPEPAASMLAVLAGLSVVLQFRRRRC